ncbi:MAG: indolepyruvate oxidoreductase subunit beta [Oscillospiraceae bacterium]|jgi:indolepyruvate ferredoxin oxidoreductase beta subunit|nr:indolepyruvate oxidoreductase subunit beta [Oscillospiraceae bacterium]
MNILLAGVGGQGTVLASKILAQCAIDRGLPVHTAETIGMAQRGGSVVSHVRIGDNAYSPLIPKGAADVLIGFEPAEAVRNIDFLKDGGTVVVSDRAVVPASSSLSNAVYDAKEMIAFVQKSAKKVILVRAFEVEKAASLRALNVALLGAAAAAGALGFTKDELAAAMPKLIAAKHMELNLKALNITK